MSKIAVAGSIVVACGFLAPAHAQQDQPASREKVEITGSSIKRIEGETALPVQILKKEDIDRIAPATTEELMHYITAITTAGSITVSQANGTITTSQSTVSLRGLGSTRTLVLVNGRRVAVFGGTNSTAVDVNSIPVEAIERIEVLKEGASSLYGSDAVAGVVNFILRRDFKGADVRATYGSPTRSGGGKEVQASAFLGFGDLDRDRYNVNIGAGYHKIDPIMGSDRSFAHNINVGERNDLSSTIAFPANILFGPNFSRIASPAFPDCGPDSIVSPFFANNANSGRACRFENSPFLTVQSGEKQENVLVNARYRFTPQVEGYVETGYVHNEISYVTQPVPVAPNTNLPATNPYNAFLRNLIATQYPNLAPGLARFSTLNDTLMLLPPSSPFYPTAFVASLGLPTNQPIAFDYRDFANGPRHTRDESDNSRIVAGARGTFGAWDYDSAFLYSESKAKSNLVAGYPQWSHFLPLLDTGVINPFGPTTDPATLAAVQAAEFRGVVYKSKTSTTSVDAKLSRELMELHGGAAALALGGELREEAFRFDPSAEFEVGDIGGFGGNVLPVDRRRHVGSVYTEIDAPFLRTFEADLGVRYDNYQTIGSTTNPKLSVRWQPNPQVLVRGSTGTGFRAPSLTDLYTAQANSVTANGTRDPIRCPNPATGQPTDCNNQFPTITGGNPNLKPEKSHSNTLGFVFEPTRDISMSIDFFWIQLKDSIVIGGLPFNFILANAANATQFSSFIIRGAPDGNASGVGPITDVIQTNANLFKRNVDGWDVDLIARPEVPLGRLTVRLSGTYLTKSDVQNADGTFTSNLDQELTATGGIVPRWHHVASATYDTGPWMVSLVENYQKGYHDIPGNFSGGKARDVGSYETWDLQGTYSGIAHWRLTLGAKNILDRDPPYTNGGGQFAAGYDVTYADVRGRFVYGTVQYVFR